MQTNVHLSLDPLQVSINSEESPQTNELKMT